MISRVRHFGNSERVRQVERRYFERLRVREFDRTNFSVQQFESSRVRQVERVRGFKSLSFLEVERDFESSTV